MNEKEDMKRLRKAYKMEKRRLVTLWKSLAILCLVLCLLLSSVSVVFTLFDNTVAAFMGLTFWELKNKDPNANYFEMDFAAREEMYDYGDEICYQVEAEGAVLLLNNGALPLRKGAQVSTLSSSSVDLVYGGTGSGNVDVSKADNLKAALEKSGFGVNSSLWDFYIRGEGKAYNRNAGAGESAVLAGQSNITEVPVDKYPEAVKNSFSAYGDAVIITLSRVGGEGYDLDFSENNYLALDENEKEMLQWAADMKASGTVKSLVVLLNTSNALQVDFLKGNPYGIDACLWIGGVGGRGINAVADILAGKVNPSGSLVDTYCYDNASSPAMKNFVPTVYGGDTAKIPDSAETYMIYQEGIYVGYKYYETRYEDHVMGTGNAGSYGYSDDVAFPFGYGLSYTTFSYRNMKVEYNGEKDSFSVSLTVTNTGAVPGKETVQIYFQSPYTGYDIENGVEKASVALCGFGKTSNLAPGASETVTVLVDKRDLASYDAYGAGTYILDKGDYYLTAATDAHDAVNNILAAKGYTAENTAGRMDGEGNGALCYKWVQETFDSKTYAVSLNGTKIENRLSNADINLYDGVKEKVTYVSRSNWSGTMPSSILKLNLTDKLTGDLQDVLYDPADYPKTEMPVLGAKNGRKLYEMMGLPYDDPNWEPLLDQLRFDDMVSMIGDSFHWRMPVESVNAPGARDENGPQGLTAALFGAGLGDIQPTAFTSEDVMAATFNTELLYEVGRVIGNNCLAANVVCLYGPGANIHRTPYSGRNFEYYSEDGFLSGEMCAAEVRGLQDKGVDVVLKHFALNDCEQDRLGQAVWVGEQAAREIYLKAFQEALEESGGNGVMTAYTRWGAVWSGGHYGLMTGILRGEWGNQGMSITDNILVQYCNGADAVMAGGVTTCDAMLWYVTKQLPKYKDDPVMVSAMREACHRNLYALVNSSAMNGIGPDTVVNAKTPVLFTATKLLAAVIGVLFVCLAVLWYKGAKSWKETEAYRNYRAARKKKDTES